MKYTYIISSVLICSLVLFAGCISPVREASVQENQPEVSTLTTSNMELSSSAFEPDGEVPPQYTCDGQDINPPLLISDVPEDAKSLVLIVDDPDAPVGDWVHWTVWNIAPDTTEIAENSVPANAVEGMTDFGRTGWGGPCPPSGSHRYFFKLFALDTELTLDHSAKKADILDAIKSHTLDKTELIGIYSRK
jgi:Raf kinase inhibitor-like YbhB/YbcL family protein